MYIIKVTGKIYNSVLLVYSAHNYVTQGVNYVKTRGFTSRRHLY